MFSATFALAGTGKLPSEPLTVSVRPAMAGPVVGGGEEEIAWLEAAGLVAAGLVAAELLVLLLPDEHAAADTPTAHAARTSAAERYLFIGSPYFVPESARATRQSTSAHHRRRPARTWPAFTARPPIAARRGGTAIRFAAVSLRPVQIVWSNACEIGLPGAGAAAAARAQADPVRRRRGGLGRQGLGHRRRPLGAVLPGRL